MSISFVFIILSISFLIRYFNWISYYDAAPECLIFVENLYSKMTVSKIFNFLDVYPLFL